MRKVYRGRDIEVSFDLDICVDVGECLSSLPDVFDTKARPWVDADGAAADEIATVIARCPSGALQFHRLDGKAEEEASTETVVTPMRNGPLLVRGDIRVRREDGTVETMPRATFCRCGLSKNKPFCDNSHIAAKFVADGERFRIHLSSVRRKLDEPVDRSEDPRR